MVINVSFFVTAVIAVLALVSIVLSSIAYSRNSTSSGNLVTLNGAQVVSNKTFKSSTAAGFKVTDDPESTAYQFVVKNANHTIFDADSSHFGVRVPHFSVLTEYGSPVIVAAAECTATLEQNSTDTCGTVTITTNTTTNLFNITIGFNFDYSNPPAAVLLSPTQSSSFTDNNISAYVLDHTSFVITGKNTGTSETKKWFYFVIGSNG